MAAVRRHSLWLKKIGVELRHKLTLAGFTLTSFATRWVSAKILWLVNFGCLLRLFPLSRNARARDYTCYG